MSIAPQSLSFLPARFKKHPSSWAPCAPAQTKQARDRPTQTLLIASALAVLISACGPDSDAPPARPLTEVPGETATSSPVSIEVSNLGTGEKISVVAINSGRTNSSSFSFQIETTGINAVSSASAGLEKSSNAPSSSKQSINSGENPSERLLSDAHNDWLENRQKEIARVRAEQRRQGNPLQSPLPPGSGKCKPPYVLGNTCDIPVLHYTASGLVEVDVTVVLQKLGTSAYWWVDQRDLTDLPIADLNTLSGHFEGRILPSDTNYFGSIPDVDHNGKIHLVFSRELIDPAISRGLLGYVNPCDLISGGICSSFSGNEGDFFYAVTPNQVLSLGYNRASYLNELMPSTMTHELKHLIAAGTRLGSDYDLEDLWLEEPSAMVAEDLAGYGSKLGLVQPYARYALPAPQIMPVIYDSRPSDSAQLYSMYGYNFLMMWKVGELVGHSNFWKNWVAGPSFGLAHLETQSGYTWREIMKHWALTLLLDNTGASAPELAEYSYKDINLRDGLWDSLGIKTLGASQSGSARSAAFYQGYGTGGNATIRVKATQPGGLFMIVRH